MEKPILPKGVIRVVAPNASPMTFSGTCTYLIGERAVAVIDPGPDNDDHLKAILNAVPANGKIVDILVTHAHRDHSGLARKLAETAGAPIHGAVGSILNHASNLGGGEGIDGTFQPDKEIWNGQILDVGEAEIQVLATPGHLDTHLCFVSADANCIFTGDHVMGWSTTFVSPPQGDMGHYLNSLDRLSAHRQKLYLPGHGDPIHDGHKRIRELRAHRHLRTRQIVGNLMQGPRNVEILTSEIYSDIPKAMHQVASRNVLAHLLYLQNTHSIILDGDDPMRDHFVLKN